MFLRQSSKHPNKLKTDLQNDFTTGDARYPKIFQATLHFLDKYRKSSILSQPTYEGASFAQKGGNKVQGGYKKTYDKRYWKTKNASSLTSNITQYLIVQKAIRKMARKIKTMTISPELFDT